MITRVGGYLEVRTDPVKAETEQLHREGYVVLRGVYTPEEVAELRDDLDRIFSEHPQDTDRHGADAEGTDPFRYESLNRSAVAQKAVGHPRILEVIEPLLGEDCHVIANTTWRQSPVGSKGAGASWWHCDAGPHVPRPDGVAWDDRIPYPVFAVAAHIMVRDCPEHAGATGVIPGSHRSGQHPPKDRQHDDSLTWEGRGPVALAASAGDVALFVSDIWHRRQPVGEDDPGRYFMQCHYGRRDIAQRLQPTWVANHLSAEAVERASTDRERTLVGLHSPGFYDG